MAMQLLTVTAAVSSSELLKLASNPILLVPAQGAKKLVYVSAVFYQYTFGTKPYTLTGPPTSGLYYGSASGTAADYNDSAVCALPSSGLAQSPGVPNNSNVLLSNVENLPLVYAVAPPNAYLGGDGTLKITVQYYILAAP